MSYDIVLKGGMVVDGTGEKPFSADVAIKDGRIAGIGQISGVATQIIKLIH